MLTLRDKAMIELDDRYRVFRIGTRWLCVKNMSQVSRFHDWHDMHAFIKAIHHPHVRKNS